MTLLADIDWRWVAGLAVAAVLAKMTQLGRDNEALRKRVEKLERIKTEPFPSDDAEEMLAIRDAKALAKKMGGTFTFDQALQAVIQIRELKKKRGGSSGGNGQRTA